MAKMRIRGSMKCEECNSRGEINYGERHGFAAYDKCPACNGKGVVPIYVWEGGLPALKTDDREPG